MKRGYYCKGCSKHFSKDKQRYKRHIRHCRQNVQNIAKQPNSIKLEHNYPQIQSDHIPLLRKRKSPLNKFERVSLKDNIIRQQCAFVYQGQQDRELFRSSAQQQDKIIFDKNSYEYQQKAVKQQFKDIFQRDYVNFRQLGQYQQHIMSLNNQNKMNFQNEYVKIQTSERNCIFPIKPLPSNDQLFPRDTKQLQIQQNINQDFIKEQPLELKYFMVQTKNVRCPLCKEVFMEEGSFNCYNLNCSYGDNQRKEQYYSDHLKKRNTPLPIHYQIIKIQQSMMMNTQIKDEPL